MKQLFAIYRASRPRQWLKNFLLFIPILFGGQLLYFEPFSRVCLGFATFCLLSSSNYIVNDVLDVASDRAHPYKKFRPVARRELPEGLALIVAILYIVAGLWIGWALGPAFFVTAVGFVILHWLSFFFFRYMSVMDVLAIATGYLIRVLAGEMISVYHISVWLFLTVLSFSLLLAIGKRRVELSFLKGHGEKFAASNPERSFPYSEKLLDAYVAVFANATFLTYAYFTFLTVQEGSGVFLRGLDSALVVWLGRKWLMITVPAALYAIMRYLQIIYSVKVGVLEKIVTSDKPLLISVVIWFVSVMFVVYGIGG